MVSKDGADSVETEVKTETAQESKQKAVPVFTLEILKLIKDSQQQHGLRHSDFQRYRGYCTRRIRRLRKTLHLPQGDKRHFKKRDVTEALLKDERYLYIPLMLSERAWAHAMQLRQEANTEPRKKFHLISRMRKASHYAHQLHALCQSDVCDARTKLEAQAYLSWMDGTLHFELHKWKEAMDDFQQAQVVYEKLCSAVDELDQSVYKHKSEELIPSLRYCAYNIGDSTAISDLKSIRGFAQGDMLEKLEMLMAQARDKEGEGIQEIEWQGKKVSVRGQSIGAFLLADEELKKGGGEAEEGDLQPQLDTLERHIISCKDAIASVRDEINSEQSGKQKSSSSSVAQLQDMLSYLTHIRLTRSNQRTLLMIKAAKQSLAQKCESGDKGEIKKTKPQDLIRLYEMVIQNQTEMQQLPGTEGNASYQANIEASINAYKAFRCYYISEVLTGTKRFREALALYDKSVGYATAAGGSLSPKGSLAGELASLVSSVESAKCICLAQAVLQGSDESSTSQASDKKHSSKVPLLERLDEYREDPKLASKQPNLVKLPPAMKPIPCKPLFFDVALNHVSLPTLDDKFEKKTNPQGISGFVKGLWGWGGGSK